METKLEWLAPCGLYCGVCGILIAHRDNNLKFKEKLAQVYNLRIEDIQCEGCLSKETFLYCRVCPIRDCVHERKNDGCHQCNDFPCEFIENFPMDVGKKVMLRAIPRWKEVGTDQWVAEEEARYKCPHCQALLFRGVKSCRECKEPVDVD